MKTHEKIIIESALMSAVLLAGMALCAIPYQIIPMDNLTTIVSVCFAIYIVSLFFIHLSEE